MSGPLEGVSILEFSGLGPGPFAGMLLSDLGADVIRVDRPAPVRSTLPVGREFEAMLRNRRSVTLDLKQATGRAAALRLIEQVDVLVEGFRPGVMERLGLGPAECAAVNERLVYARITGWGRGDERASLVGHDLNYLSVTGALHAVGPRDGDPVPPLVLAGDTGGGGMFLALGICAALLERHHSGLGQVVDAAMVDGATALMSPIYGAFNAGEWSDRRGTNRIDGGAPYYRAYRCADDRHVAVGAIEDVFFRALMSGLGLSADDFTDRLDPVAWPELEAVLARTFATRTRDEWAEIFAGTDACVTPVLSMAEAPRHPANVQRGLFADLAGHPVPAPAPRFDRTPARIRRAPVAPGTDTDQVLAAAGFSAGEVDALRQAGVLGAPS